MATVPGPRPDRPLPVPGAPGKEPPREPEEDPQIMEPETPEREQPGWMPRPYDPEREVEEPGIPIGTPP